METVPSCVAALLLIGAAALIALGASMFIEALKEMEDKWPK